MGRLFWKFLISFWLALVLAGAGVGTTVWLYRQAQASRDLAVGPRAALMVASAATALRYGGVEALRELMTEWNQGGPPYFYAVDAAGRELLGRPVAEKTLAQARATVTSETAEPRSARLATAADGGEYLFFVPAAEQPFREQLLQAPPERPPVPLLPILFGLLASLGFSALMAWYLSRPIRILKWAFNAAAAGRLEARVGHLIRQRDEIADLGHDFDRMADQLQALIEAQRRLQHDVSHELRSPLARLQVAVGLARQDPEKIGASLERIEREAARLDQLVGELLTLSRLESGLSQALLEQVDLVELVAAVAEDARFEARAAGRDVVFHGEGEVPVEVRAELLHRAIENVVRNAVKFTREGTEVEVEVSTAAGEARVTVSDRGPGVPEDDIEAIFQPFHRGGNAAGSAAGFGLGLAIARRAAEAHGGRIQAVNRTGGGLQVTLSIPLSAAR